MTLLLYIYAFLRIYRFLTYDPAKRISAEKALKHPYFFEKPFPASEGAMPSFPSTNTDSARYPQNHNPSNHPNNPNNHSDLNLNFGGGSHSNFNVKKRKFKNNNNKPPLTLAQRLNINTSGSHGQVSSGVNRINILPSSSSGLSGSGSGNVIANVGPGGSNNPRLATKIKTTSSTGPGGVSSSGNDRTKRQRVDHQ